MQVYGLCLAAMATDDALQKYWTMSELHKHLWTIVQQLPSDFEPSGSRDRDEDWGPDCSCGCKYFLPLEGQLGMDWGVCANPASPRASLLTFEHQGCKAFEADEKNDE
jgi:hypothetical protein